MKRLLLIISFFLVIIGLSACGGSNGGKVGEKVAEQPSNYQLLNTEIKYYKLAPYTTRLAGEQFIPCADFSIGMDYLITQEITYPETDRLQKIVIENITIDGPTIGTVSIDGAKISWPPSETGEYILPVNGSIELPAAYISSTTNITGDVELTLDISCMNIGTITVENWTTIYGTQAEADGYFDQLMLENRVSADDLRITVHYKLKIVTRTEINGKSQEAVYYKNVSLVLVPDDFTGTAYYDQNPYVYDDAGAFIG